MIQKSTQFQKIKYDENMRILYFTDGAGIDLMGIRQSLLRIPEVLSSLKKGQEQAKYVDLLTVMSLDEVEFKHTPAALHTLMVNLVQRGLHQRWVNRGHRADLILRKINFHHFADVKHEINEFIQGKSQGLRINPENLQLMHFLSQVEFTIIGPGFDEIEIWLRREVSVLSEIKVLIKEVIASDPQLDWFWPQVKESFVSHC